MAKVAKELSALAVSRLAKDGAHAVGGVDMKKLDKANAVLQSHKAGFKLKFTDKKGAFLGMDNVFAQLDKLKALGDNDVCAPRC